METLFKDKRTRAYRESLKPQQGQILEDELKSDIVPQMEGGGSLVNPSLAITQPWNNKDQSIGNKPWRTDVFMLKRKRHGFRCRFVTPENVEKREMRGYQIANARDYGGVSDKKVLKDGSMLGTSLMRCGMILMEIPEEEAQSLERVQEQKIVATSKSHSSHVKNEAKRIGGEIGHEIHVTDESTGF